MIYTLEAVPVGKYTVKCAESAIKSDADWNLYSGSGWYEQYAAETCQKTVSFKSDRETQEILLQQGRFFKTPYIGHHGWASVKAIEPLEWGELG